MWILDKLSSMNSFWGNKTFAEAYEKKERKRGGSWQLQPSPLNISLNRKENYIYSKRSLKVSKLHASKATLNYRGMGERRRHPNSAAQRSSHPTSLCRRVLPELARDVTKSRITAIVIWASLILLLTFHLIWVSMTAKRRARQVRFQLGATNYKTCNNFCWFGQKKLEVKSPTEEKKRGGRGVSGYFSSSHRGLLVWGSSSWLTDARRLSRTAPLRSAPLNCPAPLRLPAQIFPPLPSCRHAAGKSAGQHAGGKKGKSLPPLQKPLGLSLTPQTGNPDKSEESL